MNHWMSIFALRWKKREAELRAEYLAKGMNEDDVQSTRAIAWSTYLQLRLAIENEKNKYDAGAPRQSGYCE